MVADAYRLGALTWRFALRDFSNRFAGSFTGWIWALIQPLLQLAITTFIFVAVFKARVPGDSTIGYVPFLAVAFWPWIAFSEAVLRSTTVIQDNSALVGKVALPREVLVAATVMTSFCIHFVGFIAIVLVLALAGQPVDPLGSLLALLLYLPLLALAFGFALICASVQVFVRDLVQALGQLLPLLMFCAPVYYDRVQLPERFRGLIGLNPFTFYAESFRALVLDHGSVSAATIFIAIIVAGAVLLIGHFVFVRLDTHFEDFL